MDNFISIIVPVYNAQTSITSCIASILNQSYKKMEIIIINDGSTDQSLEVIKSKYQTNSIVKIISNDNQGVSITRNIGIQNAQYPYIVFIDADDICKPTMLESLITPTINNEKVDLVIGGYEIINKDTMCLINSVLPAKQTLSAERFAENYFDFFNMGLVNVNWNKIYKKEILDRYDIRYDVSLKLGEDACFNLAYFSHCKNIVLLDTIIYSYIIHNDQATQREFTNYYKMVETRYYRIKEYLVGMEIWEKEKVSYYKYFYNEILTSVYNVCKFNITFNRKKDTINQILLSQSLINLLKEYKQYNIRYYLIRYKRTYLLIILCTIINKIKIRNRGK